MSNGDHNKEASMKVCVKCGAQGEWTATFRGMGRLRRFFCTEHCPGVGETFHKMLVAALKPIQGGK